MKRSVQPRARELPMFQGQRLTVWDWQIRELRQMLGAQAESFGLELGLDGWLAEADELAMREPGVIVNLWRWLQQETVQEAQRRGGAVASPQAPAAWHQVGATYYEPWICRHEPRCGNRVTCSVVSMRPHS